MTRAYICGTVRTAAGRRGGALSGLHPADLGGIVLDALIERTALDPAAVEDVIFGCVSQVGPQTFNVARTSVMSSVLPDSVPGVAIDRQCGSSQQAAHFAAQAVMSGAHDVVIAGGVESMSKVPIFTAVDLALKAGLDGPFDGQRLKARYPDEDFSQFVGAERVGAKYGVTRAELVDFAVRSHELAIDATDTGRLTPEIVGVKVETAHGTTLHDRDEGIRAPDRAKIEALPALVDGGLINAAMASQIADGASAILIANERGVAAHGLTPIAEIIGMSVAGSDPTMVLEGPIPATRQLLAKAGVSIGDIDNYEVNEAFGTVPLAWAKALGADLDRLNVHGGAQALGHPLGATGTKLLGSLINTLNLRGGGVGLVSICEGLGTANSTLIKTV